MDSEKPRLIRGRDRVVHIAADIGKPVLIAVITYIVMGGLSVASGLFPRPAVLDRVDPSRADLGRFVPLDYTVTKRIISNLDGEDDAEVVLSLTGRQEDLLPRDVIILGYDRNLRRWVKVYDALEQAWLPPWRSTDDPSAKKFVPDVSDLSVGLLEFKGTKRRDVAIGANVSGGSTPQHRVDVVRFHDHVVSSVYSFENLGPGRLKIEENQLHVTALWFTPYNAACCAERRYQFTVEPSRRYAVVSSDRPLMGVAVAGDDHPGLLVGSVVHGSAADGVLESGDELVTIDSTPTDATGEELAKAFSAHRPGDDVALSFLRNGELMQRVVHVGERDLKPTPSRLATVGASLAEDARGRVTVSSLSRFGTLATSGPNDKDQIAAVGGRQVSRPAAVAAELQRALGSGHHTSAIEVHGPGGTRSVDVWIDTAQDEFGGDVFLL